MSTDKKKKENGLILRTLILWAIAINKKHFGVSKVPVSMLINDYGFNKLRIRYALWVDSCYGLDEDEIANFKKAILSNLFYIMCRCWAIKYQKKVYSSVTFQNCPVFTAAAESFGLRGFNAFGKCLSTGEPFSSFISEADSLNNISSQNN